MNTPTNPSPTPNLSSLNVEEEDDDQDRVQAWQTQLPQPISQAHKHPKGPLSSISDYHSSLERANSAAARLDSLARLNGVKTPTSNEGEDEENEDDLPPFLRAKHLEETNKKKHGAQLAAAQSLRLPTGTSDSLSAYPLAHPHNLGFGVGPNGRGVPRLSALQRKALEKMEKNAHGPGSSQPGLGVAKSLSRSHTTTGTERTPRLDVSALQGRNRLARQAQIADRDPSSSTEREQARSNLIRKLSNRGALNSSRRQKSSVPASEPPPALAIPIVDTNHNLLPPVGRKSRPRSGSLNDLEHPPSSPNWTQRSVMAKEGHDIDLMICAHDSKQVKFQPASPDSSECPPAQPPSLQRQGSSLTSNFFSGEGLSVDPGPETAATEGLSVDKKISGSSQQVDRHSLAHSSTRTTTPTTNRASSSGVSNFTLNSEFRSYRHSVERDRDSVLDRMGLLDNTLDGELLAEAAGQSMQTAGSDIPGQVSNQSIGASSLETDEIEADARQVDSLAPFMNYKGDHHDSIESASSTLCAPHSPAARMNPIEVIVYQTTTTTTLSSSSSSPATSTIIAADGLISPTSRSHVTVDRSEAILNDIILSPPPTLPETVVRDDTDCLTDYKFPCPTSSSSARTLTKMKNDDEHELENRMKGERTLLIDRSSYDVSSVPTSAWPEYCASPPTAPLNIGAKHTMSDSSYEEQVSRALEEMSRGSTASSLSALVFNPDDPLSHSASMQLKRRLSNQTNDKNRPQRPCNPPPISQAHRTLSRSPPTLKTQSRIPGPSQFPPAANMRSSHLPPASATDLARYNDLKLAPFPALLAFSPPVGSHSTPIPLSNSVSSSSNVTSTTAFTSPSMSTGASESSVKSPRSSQTSKVSRSHGNSILSTATSFFSSNANRNRAGSASSTISVNLISSPKLIDSSNFGHCPSVGSISRIMSPSLSQSGALSHNDAEEQLEEIEQSSSVPDADSGPVQRRNTHSVMTNNGLGRSNTIASNASALVPHTSLKSRSSTSRSSLSSHQSSTATSEHRQRILQKLGPFLNLADLTKPNLSRRPSMLNQPPRKLQLHGPVLQVVNSTSVKDRYLFLFNDILVITKPIVEFEEQLSEDGERVPKLPITLKNSFLTKSVVEINKLECVTPRLDTSAMNGHVSLVEPTLNPLKQPVPSHVLLEEFITNFAIDPARTVTDTIARGLVKDDQGSVAKMLFLTPGLDKKQLGAFLCAPTNTKLLKAFVDRYKFHHCRIDDALRVLMLSLRLPNDVEAVERLLAGFAAQWAAVNEAIGIPQSLALKLVKALLGLNDVLHSSLHDSTKYITRAFALPQGMADSVEQFVDGLRVRRDGRSTEGENGEEFAPEKLISDEKLGMLLVKAYAAVRRDKLVQAKATEEETERIVITNPAARLDPEGGGLTDAFPNRLTYQIASAPVTFTIPEPDPHFAIKLFSTGLKFEPPFLTFSKSRSCSFRILGRSLGLCNITFVKIGSHASRYVGLPLAKTILVERAFMRDTLQITFMNHLHMSRKYLFSFETSAQRTDFTELVARSQHILQQAKPSPHAGAIAQAAAMQVLRDTLIPNEEFMPLTVNPHTHTTITLRSKQSTKKNETENPGTAISNSNKPHRIRSNSLSETYIFGTGSAEKTLQAAIVSKRALAQQLHIKKKQQKLLALQLRQNIEGGRAGLNPYSMTKAEEIGGGKDEVEEFQEKFWRSGEELVTQCQQNSLIPLVLGFLSKGVVVDQQGKA